MVDENFDKKKIIAALRAQGVSDKEIEKLYGPLPKPTINSKKAEAFRKEQAWKYNNKHNRQVREEDSDPDYEPIEELRNAAKKKPKPRISKKKKPPKPPKNDWNTASENRLKALYEAGYSTEEMAKEFKTTNDAITGKLTRMRKAGWKGTIGTTHSPIPSPSPSSGTTPQAANRKLNPTMRKFLANALEVNFGAVGRFFSKKWGLIDPPKKVGTSGGSGSGPEVTAAVIKSNEMVIASLTKLDTAFKRGTSTLTKSLGISTGKMTDAINNAVELIRKNQTSETLGSSSPSGKAGGSGTGGSGGIIAALLGGVGLAAILASSRSEASVNSNDQIEPEPTSPDNGDITPPEVEIKVKELKFEADDITFESDEFSFKNKRGGGQSSGATPGAGATPGSGTPGGGAPGSGPGGSNPSSSTPASGGFFNSMMDKLRGGPGGAGFFNGLADSMIGGRGGGGYAGGGGMDGSGNGPDGSGGGFGGGGGGGGGGGNLRGNSPNLPSDSDLDAKDNKWFGGKGSGAKGSPTSNNPADATGVPPRAGSEDVNAAIKEAADAAGMDPNSVKAIASIESSMNASSNMNKGTQYKGLFQIGRDEWNRTGPKGGNIYDSHDNASSFAKLANENAAGFKKSFGRPPTDNEIYMMHQQGLGFYTKGAMTNIQGNPYPGMRGPQTHESFEAGWGRELDRRRAHFQKADQNAQGANGVQPETQGPPTDAASNVGKPPADVDKNPAIRIKPDGSVFDKGAPDLPGGQFKSLNSADMTDLAGPDTGSKLNDLQKEQDDTAQPPAGDAGAPAPTMGIRGDADGGDSFQTTLLETQGPDHFSDYAMDEDVTA